MLKYHIVIKGNELDIIIDELKANINNYYLYEEGSLYIFITEKYFLRTMSDMTTTIILNYYEEGSCDIEIISGGGTDGVTDWGAESDRNNGISNFLKELSTKNKWDIEGHILK